MIPRITTNPSQSNDKNMASQQNLSREGCPPKSMDRASKALIRGAAQRLKVILKELQRSTAEAGASVYRTTISRTLHRVGLYERVIRKKAITFT